MKALVNGEQRELTEGMTVTRLLEELKLERNGIAVAVNEELVRGATFGEHRLREGDVVEIISAVAGG